MVLILNILVVYMISHLRSKQKVQKDEIIKSERKMCHEKDHCSFRMMTSFRRVIIRNMLLMKYFTFKASSTRFIDKFKKSNMIWQDAKEALTTLKSWWALQQLFFLFYVKTTCWRRKLHFSLSSHRPVDQRGTKLKICKLQWSYLKVYIKLENEEEMVSLIEYFFAHKRPSSSTFSIFWIIRKLLIITSACQIFSTDLY